MGRIPIIKIFVSGEGGVGKTTLIERYIKGVFNANTIMTIGVHHNMHKTKTPSGKDIMLQIWDLGGEERFKIVVPIYVKGSAAGLVVFDESRYKTFVNLPIWMDLIHKGVKKDIPLILVSTKADLVEGKRLKDEDINDFLEKYNVRTYIRTSSKTGMNVNEVFEKLVAYIEEEGYI